MEIVVWEDEKLDDEGDAYKDVGDGADENACDFGDNADSKGVDKPWI
jgi:hypothetical protein